MAIKHDLKVGDKVDLYLGHPPYFRTLVEDVISESSIIAPIPTYRGVTIILRREQELKLYYTRHTGRMCVDVRVKQFYLSGNLRTVELEVTSPPHREQRRSAFRLNTKIKTVVCFFPDNADIPHDADALLLMDGDKEIAYTKNISETGVALIMKKACDPGEKLLLEIYLDNADDQKSTLQTFAEVRQTDYDPVKKTHQVGLQFLDIEDKAQQQLSKFIFKQQLEQRKQQRLVEGE